MPGTGAHGQRDVQYGYHRELFPALHDWERTERSIVGFTGEEGPSGLLGLDQMGHFGPQGCDLVADAVVTALGPGRSTVDLCELGSGFGGALRYTVDRLATRGVTVRRAFGVDLVAEHCAVSRRISRAQGREAVTELCASATAVPLADAALDVVVVTGSMPHFPRPGDVLREAGRLLRPGGLLVLTEEVGLRPGDEEPSAAFRATHPPEVFFTTSLTDRMRQFAHAGFADVERRDLTEWAVELLAERLKVVRIFRGSVAGIYGTESTDLIRDTLMAAREEYLAGRSLPTLFTARRSGRGAASAAPATGPRRAHRAADS
ncbi:class I SAM-dependent methyltransferase [Streptomyces albireticuli]|uniref:class I SAM-dependent methyltransferase n=1 Tax=Streptomyces albireticuli TaxID=1940 RepID=UPI001E42A31E|nr:class I SAM-dependent methyltransferase [Streptomyces albireticuli]MCD9195219.1 class I SAM-dependent methyltransferase [Streptomyces albireticuli]